MDHLTFMYKAYSFCYINHYFPNLLSPQARCGAFNELRYRPRWLSGFMAVEIQYQIQFAELHINEIESRIGQYPSRNSCSNSSFLILPMWMSLLAKDCICIRSVTICDSVPDQNWFHGPAMLDLLLQQNNTSWTSPHPLTRTCRLCSNRGSPPVA